MLQVSEVQSIVKLARIDLSDNEILKFQKELASVLEYFEILREVDVSAVEPMTHSVSLQNVSRKDVVKGQKPDMAKLLLDMAPETKDGYVKVKSIL